MTGKTHLIGGIEAGLIMAVLNSGTPETVAVTIGSCMLGSMLPDIDHKNSKISQEDVALGFVSRAISGFTKHRGILHTVVGCAIFGAMSYAISHKLVSIANTSIGFMLALLTFLLIHLQRRSDIKKYGSIIAVLVYTSAPFFMSVFDMPEFYLPTGYEKTIGLCVAVGAFSHIVLDTFTKQGIMWFFPISGKRIHLASIKQKGAGETIFVILSAAFIFAWGLNTGII